MAWRPNVIWSKWQWQTNIILSICLDNQISYTWIKWHDDQMSYGANDNVKQTSYLAYALITKYHIRRSNGMTNKHHMEQMTMTNKHHIEQMPWQPNSKSNEMTTKCQSEPNAFIIEWHDDLMPYWANATTTNWPLEQNKFLVPFSAPQTWKYRHYPQLAFYLNRSQLSSDSLP